MLASLRTQPHTRFIQYLVLFLNDRKPFLNSKSFIWQVVWFRVLLIKFMAWGCRKKSLNWPFSEIAYQQIQTKATQEPLEQGPGRPHKVTLMKPSTHPDPWGANPRGRRTSSRSSSPWLRLRCGRTLGTCARRGTTSQRLEGGTNAFSHRHRQRASRPRLVERFLLTRASDFWLVELTCHSARPRVRLSVCLRACVRALSSYHSIVVVDNCKY